MANEPPRQPGALDELAFDIAYAISRSSQTPRKFSMVAAEMLTKEIIAHLVRARWTIKKLPPDR